MLKGVYTVVLGRCGAVSSEAGEEQRNIDNSNVHYSKNFKTGRAHSEVAKEIKQVIHHVQQQADVKQPQDIVSEGPVQRFKEERSGRENGLFLRKRRQLKKACGLLVRGKLTKACGMLVRSRFNHAA